MDQNIKKAYQKKAELDKRIAYLDNEISDLSLKIENLKSEKSVLVGKIDLLHEIFGGSIQNEKMSTNKSSIVLEKNS